MRRTALPTLIGGLLAIAASPAHAITGGSPDGTGHRNVGGLVSPEPFGDGTSVYCTGTLISSTVVLTAAHCATEERVLVTFDPAYEPGDPVFAGTFHGDPAYRQAQSDPHDIAVVVLDAPITDITPALLPGAGTLGRLRAGQRFTSVGYGATAVTTGRGGHRFVYDDVRNVATGTLNAVTPAWLRISMNPARGDGGTCYGDSGGPNFLGTSNVVAATTITGDAVCRATNVDQRLDTAAARAFLGDYVALP